MEDEELLHGGVDHAGAVVRSGGHVLRPANPHSASIHRFLEAIRDRGFTGAPRPVGLDADGRERLEFVPGDVPLPAYPDWAQADAVLASVAALVRRLHDSSRGLDLETSSWRGFVAAIRGLGDPPSGRSNLGCVSNLG